MRVVGVVLAVSVGLTGSGACRRPPPPSCNALVNEAPHVPFTPVPGLPPAMTGGPLEDGVYVATRADGYGAATPSGRHMTLEIRDGGTRLAWAGEILDAAGGGNGTPVRVNAVVRVAGNSLAITTTCSSVSPSPLPDVMRFAATPGTLRLAFVEGETASVTTYTRQH